MVRFGQTRPDGLGLIGTLDSDLCITNTVFQFFSGSPQRGGNPINIIAATCGRFHAVILQEASDHVPHITDQFIAHTGKTDLAILLNKDTFEPDPAVFAKPPQAKIPGARFYSSFEAFCVAPLFLVLPTVTFCSVHVVAKKRDASTDLLRPLHVYMHQHNVDFIGSDFNMSA